MSLIRNRTEAKVWILLAIMAGVVLLLLSVFGGESKADNWSDDTTTKITDSMAYTDIIPNCARYRIRWVDKIKSDIMVIEFRFPLTIEKGTSIQSGPKIGRGPSPAELVNSKCTDAGKQLYNQIMTKVFDVAGVTISDRRIIAYRYTYSPMWEDGLIDDIVKIVLPVARSNCKRKGSSLPVPIMTPDARAGGPDKPDN